MDRVDVGVSKENEMDGIVLRVLVALLEELIDEVSCPFELEKD